MREFVTQTRMISTNGVRLHVETAGNEDDPLVILLHGFPENWAGWRNQISPLARSGLFVVVPDQRGYNLSERPPGVDSYRMDLLVGDVLGLMDHFGRENAVVIGHDWGAGVAWQVALRHPERVSRLGILNVPHPAAHVQTLMNPLNGQVLRSWYIYFFQIPGLPEWLLSRFNYAPMRRMMRVSSQPGTFSKQDLQRYTDAWSQPAQNGQIAALTGMINWYRAAVKGALQAGQKRFIQEAQVRCIVPTIILWGEKDIALVPELAQRSLEWCDQGRLVRFPEASHWVQHEAPERVNDRLIDFLREPE